MYNGDRICSQAGGAEHSVHWTTQYEKLAQDPSDDDAENDVVFLQDSVTPVARVSNGMTSNGRILTDSHSLSVEEAVRTGLLTKTTRPIGDMIQVGCISVVSSKEILFFGITYPLTDCVDSKI